MPPGGRQVSVVGGYDGRPVGARRLAFIASRTADSLTLYLQKYSGWPI